MKRRISLALEGTYSGSAGAPQARCLSLCARESVSHCGKIAGNRIFPRGVSGTGKR